MAGNVCLDHARAQSLPLAAARAVCAHQSTGGQLGAIQRVSGDRDYLGAADCGPDLAEQCDQLFPGLRGDGGHLWSSHGGRAHIAGAHAASPADAGGRVAGVKTRFTERLAAA